MVMYVSMLKIIFTYDLVVRVSGKTSFSKVRNMTSGQLANQLRFTCAGLIEMITKQLEKIKQSNFKI